jgi:hypothetical protein
VANTATAKVTKAPAKPRKAAIAKKEVTSAPESVNKMTAPAKPRKVTAKKEKAAPPSNPMMPPREEIEQLARIYWAQRGYVDGFAEQDWLRAEQELLQMAS